MTDFVQISELIRNAESRTAAYVASNIDGARAHSLKVYAECQF